MVVKRENRNAFLRGGNWNNETNAGAFALNLNNSPTNTNNNIGFRCASDQQSARMEWYVFKDTYPVSKDHQVFSCLTKDETNKMPVFLHLKSLRM
jgi:hypothetical protein